MRQCGRGIGEGKCGTGEGGALGGGYTGSVDRGGWKNLGRIQDRGCVCEVRKEREEELQPWLRTRVQRCKRYPMAIVLDLRTEGLSSEI